MTSQRAIFPEPHIEGHTSSKADQGQEENDGVLMKVPKWKASNTSDCETVRAFEPVESCGVQVVKNTSHPRMRKLKPFLQEQTATTGNGNKRPDPANPLCWRCLLLLEKRFWMLGSGGDRCFLVGKTLFSAALIVYTASLNACQVSTLARLPATTRHLQDKPRFKPQAFARTVFFSNILIMSGTAVRSASASVWDFMFHT